ncbi:phage murein endopeptidase [Escherichia coli O145:H28]|nr:phage murein endopeptidase [Escherichia coli O145:H28]
MLSAFTVILLVVCGALSLGLNHYRDNAITYKEQRDKKSVSWSWQMQPLLICSSASVMLLHLMPDTRGN